MPPAVPTLELTVDGEPVGHAQPWPGRMERAHLVLVDQRPDHLKGPHVAQWLHQLAVIGFREVRTGALSSEAAQHLEQHGFRVIQHLALLSRQLPVNDGEWIAHPRVPAGGDLVTVHTARRPQQRRALLRGPGRVRGSARRGRPWWDQVCAVDRAAFGDDWFLDPLAVLDACSATPSARVRCLHVDAHLAGWILVGRAGHDAYLQRLSVHPQMQGAGVGAALVADALRWLSRRGSRRVHVNTHVDNQAALSLYHRAGFTESSDGLYVLEREVTRA